MSFGDKQDLIGLTKYFNTTAESRLRWKKRNWYYHQKVIEYLRFFIPENMRVLEIGSGDGELLNALKPSRGVGIDASDKFVAMASKQFPNLEFRHDYAEIFKTQDKFDYIVLSDLVGHLRDVQGVFENIQPCCIPSTRIVINYYNYFWEPLLMLGSKIGLRMKLPIQNWLSLRDLENLLLISGFETVKVSRKMLFPFYIPLISDLFNRILANVPFINKFCLQDFIIARPMPVVDRGHPSACVLVACKNEKGNIEELVRRIPHITLDSEIIFVDGDSTDGTKQEIERIKALFPEKNIRVFSQKGSKGKGSAVRQGFEEAKADILIILDADISVEPEEVRKFYNLLVTGRGEFINGSRLVYPMDKQAMRFLNILGNKFFSMAFTFLLGQRIKDTLCGTKALYRSDYQKIAANRAYFGDFDPFGDFDLLFGASKLNLKIVEVPVRYRERRYGSTKIRRFYHGWLLLGMCWIALRKLKMN